jgi:hypothetical protein
MKGSIRAQVRRILTGPEGRALVHAVDDAGLEYKIEVPSEAVREVSPEQGHILALSWSLEAAPRAAEPPTTTAEPPSTATTRRSTPSAVDQAFMALMAGRRSSASAADASVRGSPSPRSATARDATKELAEALGIKST